MQYIIRSNKGYLIKDGSCKENITSNKLYWTFESIDSALEFIKELVEIDEQYSCYEWEWLKSLKVQKAWWEEENENN